MTTAILVAVAGCAAGAHAQPRSRVDVQLGAMLAGARPGVVMGGTGWITERAGVSAQTYFFSSGRWNGSNFEAWVRRRGFVEPFEVDFGMGLRAVKWSDRPPPSRPPRRAQWRAGLTAEFLVGRRLAERFHVKWGMNIIVGPGLLMAPKLLVVVPLGSL